MLIGFNFGRGANNPGCAVSPEWIRSHDLAQRWASSWIDIVGDTGRYPALIELAEAWPKLARLVDRAIDEHGRSIIIGGDHTTAIGTWNGLSRHGRTGLIWIDAHLDSHTPQTSHSGNLHGMPLAALLGHGDIRLVGERPCLDPKSVCVIGARNFEAEEPCLLNSLGVRVIYDGELRARTSESVVKEAIAIATTETDNFGVSLDLDVIDTAESPGVGCPAAGGISAAKLFEIVDLLEQHKPQAWEIVEYNPFKDEGDKTIAVLVSLLDRISRAYVPEPYDRSAHIRREFG